MVVKAKKSATSVSSTRRTTQRTNGRCTNHRAFMNGKLERLILLLYKTQSRGMRSNAQMIAENSGYSQYSNIPQHTTKTKTLATADSCRSTNRDKASIFLCKTESAFSFAGTVNNPLPKETLRRKKKYSALTPKYTETSAKAHANIIETAIPSFEEYTASKKAADAIAHKTPRNATEPHMPARSDRERKSSEAPGVAKSFSIDFRKA